MFDKTKAIINEQINDRITSPVRTAVMIACAAFLMAGLALIIASRDLCHSPALRLRP